MFGIRSLELKQITGKFWYFILEKKWTMEVWRNLLRSNQFTWKTLSKEGYWILGRYSLVLFSIFWAQKWTTRKAQPTEFRIGYWLILLECWLWVVLVRTNFEKNSSNFVPTATTAASPSRRSLYIFVWFTRMVGRPYFFFSRFQLGCLIRTWQPPLREKRGVKIILFYFICSFAKWSNVTVGLPFFKKKVFGMDLEFCLRKGKEERMKEKAGVLIN